ncbi:oxygen-independent coproporphyrinogen III oxidase [Arcicella sp. LKC2W]|uniref:oxygen-independent coproporphyrinogen III oxidase n=1 Tax=Arcicella sp. LKC2W TaxID=2984198 RepID=UPI002B21F4F9|nr:oxygen-independent coproporphyrinogen III oxidase [Arcicella sp. LKC2W]MEA5458457.1 oxygen-independent coproporphyrinogen III oxidase [Arcicella sp. LKC2W]
MNPLISKYNVAGPRYTSYPTVPYWQSDTYSNSSWLSSLNLTFQASNNFTGISLYIHLPYCESLCTFCGCNKRITKNHEVEKPYIQAVLKEWQLYLNHFTEKPRISEIHLGGGTPSFFKPEMLKMLIEGILDFAILHDNIEFSFEGHPANTSSKHLQTLYDLGFRRVSFGVQDYDPIVQKAIHRIQSLDSVQRVTNWSKQIGYESVSHDLVFGLPFQTKNSMIDTIHKTLALQPDRIAFYSYAHVPWLKGNGQRGFKDADLPSAELKRELYEIGRDLFEKNGYVEIGMDHFALAHDSMFKAMQNQTLHRNFMGYTTTQTKVVLGLGVSSISDSWSGFSQNVKDIDEYLEMLENNQLPLLRGHILTEEDLVVRQQILDIMCQFKTSWQTDDFTDEERANLFVKLEGFKQDGLLSFDENSLIVQEAGKPFIRNICMAFDKRMLREQIVGKLFSQTV